MDSHLRKLAPNLLFPSPLLSKMAVVRILTAMLPPQKLESHKLVLEASDLNELQIRLMNEISLAFCQALTEQFNKRELVDISKWSKKSRKLIVTLEQVNPEFAARFRTTRKTLPNDLINDVVGWAETDMLLRAKTRNKIMACSKAFRNLLASFSIDKLPRRYPIPKFETSTFCVDAWLTEIDRWLNNEIDAYEETGRNNAGIIHRLKRRNLYNSLDQIAKKYGKIVRCEECLNQRNELFEEDDLDDLKCLSGPSHRLIYCCHLEIRKVLEQEKVIVSASSDLPISSSVLAARMLKELQCFWDKPDIYRFEERVKHLVKPRILQKEQQAFLNAMNRPGQKRAN